jgi:glycosyltransferase involved in cell wall biosynthesis
MKILLIDVNCKHSSTGRIVYDLYNEFNNMGHTAAICYGRGELINEPNIYKHNNLFEVSLHALRTRLTGYVGYGSEFATKRLIKYINNFEPDIVHLLTIHGYHVDMYALLDFLKSRKFKVVYTLNDECTQTGKCGHAFECDKWLEKCENCPQLREYPKSLWFDRTAKEFTLKKNIFQDFPQITFVPGSQWIGELSQRSIILKGHKFYVIYTGIDTSSFQPMKVDRLRKKHNLTDDKVLIFVTPNFDDPYKGGQYLIDLAYRLSDEKIKIFIIGNRNPIKNLPGNVIAVGRIESKEELAEYYSLGDLFVITSYMETFPTVCIESLCCGTPIVGFDRGGIKETAPEGCGVFVPFGDVDSLTDVIKKTLKGDIRLKPKSECSKISKEIYDKAHMARKYLTIYEEMNSNI